MRKPLHVLHVEDVTFRIEGEHFIHDVDIFVPNGRVVFVADRSVPLLVLFDFTPLKGFPRSAAFAAASHGKAGLAQSMARELMPQGIHVAHVPIDAAIGWEQPNGSRAHRLAGQTEDDNMAHPDRIAEVYLQLHRQHRSTWAFEVVLRPWKENW